MRIRTLLLTILMVFLSVGLSKAQPLLVEDFDYTAGTTLTSNGWTAHNSSGSNPIQVVSPGLTFLGYAGSNIGNAAGVNNTGEDVHRTFSEQTSGTVYAAFIVKTEASNSQGYFFHLGQTSIGTTFFTRVWVNATGSGLSLGISAPSTWANITPGVPTLVVVKHVWETKKSSLYVFNTFPTEEPATPNIVFDETLTYTNVGSVGLRQYNAAQRIIVDGIRIATTWAEAVKEGTKYTVNYSVVGSNGTLSATVNGSAIANGDQVLEGRSVVFTATPDAGYRVKEWINNGTPVAGNTSNSYTIASLTGN
ncbi:MAG TPA: hypothetical protein PK990_07890, partial [Salinivirgaceae bacterium]|nr:hypothetical protein [Salinivirgaceae bacterium]